MRDVAALARENFRTHATFPSRGIPEARIEESDSLTWIDSGLSTDSFNLVLGSTLDADAVTGRAREVVDHFTRVARPFSWWVSPGDRPDDLGQRLAETGLAPEEWELAMACPIASLRAPAPVDDLVIERAATPASLGDFARINAENWTPPDALVERYYARDPARLLSADAPLRFYVARRQGTAVAAVEIAVSPGAVGVYNLSTRTGHRGRGIGGALLSAALKAVAGETRAERAVLQAAPEASGLYRRLGFTEFGRIAEFKPIRNVR